MTRAAVIGSSCSLGGFGLALLLDLPPGPVIGLLCLLLLCLPSQTKTRTDQAQEPSHHRKTRMIIIPREENMRFAWLISGITACAAALATAVSAATPVVIGADGILCNLTKTLAADQAKVKCIVGPGKDHNLRLAPQRATTISQCRFGVDQRLQPDPRSGQSQNTSSRWCAWVKSPFPTIQAMTLTSGMTPSR